MSSSVLAARACAKTILWQSLRFSSFQGAIPHVLLIVDQTPCALQKILLEGYLQELEDFNNASTGNVTYPLRIDLNTSTTMPRYSVGLDKDWKVTYSVLPFVAGTFLDDVRSLQAFLRQCGQSVAVENGDCAEVLCREKFEAVFESLLPYLASYGDNNVDSGDDLTVKGAVVWKDALLNALRVGPPRELLGCILIQRNAFQNELEKYRLRLDLFNMGLRVAEHNHLECMSRSADALASGEKDEDKKRCLEDSEVINYMQSCSMEPRVAELIGRAIADSIDVLSWERRFVDESQECNNTVVGVMPPASFYEALASKELRSIYNDGVLVWKGMPTDKQTEAAVTGSSSAKLSKISGPGAPLRIICRDGQVLSFEGGLEDCLLNTGYYAAAHTQERNSVCTHRQRFPVHETVEDKKKDGSACDLSKLDDANKRGRLKKKEHIALLKLMKKQNTVDRTSLEPNGVNDCDDDGAVRRKGCGGGGACVGSSIGGTFPVGEVITESFDLSKLNGTCTIFAYPSLFKEVVMAYPKPVTLRIEKGIVTDIAPGAPEEFVELIELVRQAEGACYVRELGIGLSPFVGKEHIVSDVTAFERQFGVHVSLGQRHPLFVKQTAKRNESDGSVAVHVEGPVLKRKAGKYHIDVFLDAARLEMGPFTVDFTKGGCFFPADTGISSCEIDG